jgi:hypothetical protein
MPTAPAPTPGWDAGAAADPSPQPGPPTEPESVPSDLPPTYPGSQPAEEPDASTLEAAPGIAQPAPGSVPQVPAADEADWLDRICPYLLSEDGTYRSTQPDPGHRCTAQDPPGTLPLAFQERFCLTERHDRCEMYKYAQTTRSSALEEEGIPAAQVSGARFRPAVRSVPLALGPADGQAGGGASRRPIVLIAIAIAALVILAFVLAILFGSGSDDQGPGALDDASPSAQAIPAATATPEPTPEPTAVPEQTPEPGGSAAATEAPAVATIPVSYEVQEGEALLAIAEKFGVSRRRILRANEGMEERSPYVEAGDVIIVPAASSLTIEELEAIPGFLGLTE